MGTFGLCDFNGDRCKYHDECEAKAPVVEAFSWCDLDGRDLLVSCRCGIGAILTGDMISVTPSDTPKRYPAGKWDGQWAVTVGFNPALKRALTCIFPSEGADPLFVNGHGRTVRYDRNSEPGRPTRPPHIADIVAAVGWDTCLASDAVEIGHFALATEKDGMSEIRIYTGIQAPKPLSKGSRFLQGRVSALAWSGNGRYLAVGMSDGRVFLSEWAVEANSVLNQVDVIDGAVTGISWSACDTQYAFSGPDASKVMLRGVMDVSPLSSIPQDRAAKIDLGNLNLVATRLFDGQIQLWKNRLDTGWAVSLNPVAAHTVGSHDIGWMGEISLNPANDRLAVYSHAERGVAIHRIR